MAVTQQNLGSTTQGNMVVNTLTTDTYQQSEGGRVGQQLDEHDHSGAKGLAVKRIQSGLDAAKPTGGTAAGTVYVATDTGILYFDDGADLDAVGTLDTAQTWSAVQTFSANVILNALWSDAAQVSVASAATFALPTTGNNVNVTGTTGITDFSGPATQGVLYKLQFTNATPGSVTSGNHAKLNGNLTTAQNNILYLYWDGTNAWEIGRYTGTPAGVTSTTFTNSLGSDVALNNSANYFDGPSVAQGTSGTWLAVGGVTLLPANTSVFDVKLWDGTTVIDSKFFQSVSTAALTVSLSGRLATPAGNIRISVKDTGATTSSIKFNSSGNSKDATITVVQIA